MDADKQTFACLVSAILIQIYQSTGHSLMQEKCLTNSSRFVRAKITRVQQKDHCMKYCLLVSLPMEEYLIILTLKTQLVLYRMIDANNKNQMKFEELHEIIKWTLKGIGKLFLIKIPKGKEIQIISYKAFVSADATNDNNIDFTELVNWVELNQQFITFLQDYEPTNPIHYDSRIFRDFHKIDVNNFELDPLNLTIDTNRLVKALTQSRRLKIKTQANSPNNPTTMSDEQDDAQKIEEARRRKLFFQNNNKTNILASLQLNDFKQSQLIKANSASKIIPDFNMPYSPAHQSINSAQFEVQNSVNVTPFMSARNSKRNSISIRQSQTSLGSIERLNSIKILDNMSPKIVSQQFSYKDHNKDTFTTTFKSSRSKQSSLKQKRPVFKSQDGSIKGKKKSKFQLPMDDQWSPNANENNYSNPDFVELEQDLMVEINTANEDNKGYITIDDYVRACQNHTSLKFISISLFKYFDKKSCGSITFVDMIKAMIPGLQKHHIDKVIKWVKLNHIKYQEIDEEIKKPNDTPLDQRPRLQSNNFLSESTSSLMGSSQNQQTQSKNNVHQRRRLSQQRLSQDIKFISNEEITEFRNIFDLYDKKNRGLLDRDSFLMNLSTLYSYGDCIEKLKNNGLENAKDIRIDQFVQMLKPFNTVVPEIVLNNLRVLYEQKYQRFLVNQAARNIKKSISNPQNLVNSKSTPSLSRVNLIPK
ncbi:UNKNOWN [Stylonychia lemnae]|uniref:EF-hand domain-containing protein n=1 Tax=Stylonychia lemnae TaxID=5949 RepID=A0A078B5D3_STYLE|nr:UNKNOWN [Stylonychia lemnae]|eukprot:CDW89735.1 UNKNOWN [Stylonychia lemnae]